MAILISYRVAIFAIMIGVIGAYCGHIKVGNGQCQGDLQGLITQCAAYVQKPGPMVDPSKECCNVIKSIDVPCVCKHITKEAEQLISMSKAMHCLASCGKQLPPGFKCGSS